MFQTDIVALIAPDFVISSNAERYLCKVDADEDSQPLIFKQYGDSTYTPSPIFIEAFRAQFSYNNHRGIYEAWVRKM